MRPRSKPYFHPDLVKPSLVYVKKQCQSDMKLLVELLYRFLSDMAIHIWAKLDSDTPELTRIKCYRGGRIPKLLSSGLVSADILPSVATGISLGQTRGNDHLARASHVRLPFYKKKAGRNRQRFRPALKHSGAYSLRIR